MIAEDTLRAHLNARLDEFFLSVRAEVHRVAQDKALMFLHDLWKQREITPSQAASLMNEHFKTRISYQAIIQYFRDAQAREGKRGQNGNGKVATGGKPLGGRLVKARR